MSYDIKDEDYLKLWMYFEGEAAAIMGAMFNTITWVLGFAAALLGFIFSKLTDFDATKSEISLTALVVTSSIAGIVLCTYALFALSESSVHIHKNWERAGNCKQNIKNLNKLIKTTSNTDTVVQIWNRLRIIVLLFMVSFLSTFIFALYN